MQIFRNRPLALSASLFAVTAVFALQLSARQKRILLLAMAAFFLVLCSCFLYRRCKGRRLLLSVLCLGGVLLSLLSSYLFFDVRYAGLQQLNGKECTAEGVVTERIGSAAYYAHFRVRLESLDGEACGVGALLECEYPSSLQVGDRFQVSAVPREFTRDELFDEETYSLSDGCLMILCCSSSENCVILEERENGLLIAVTKLNTRLSYSLRNAVGGEADGVAAALLLGNRSWLSDDTTLAFQRAGISHLLALSGLHVSIIIGFLEIFFRKLRFSKALRALLIPLAAVGYLVLTGCAVSTCRAVLMICVLYLGFLFRAEYDAFTALSITVVLILTATPYAVLDLSLWLSFLAAGSIIVFSPAVVSFFALWKDKRRPPQWFFWAVRSVSTALSVGVMANLAILLLSASVFGEISLMSVPATMVLSIPVTVLLILSAILLCLPFLPILPKVCAILGDLILNTAAYISEIDRVLLPVGDAPTRICLWLLTAVLIFFAVAKLRRKRWVLLLPILCCAAVFTSWCVTNLSDREYRAVIPAGEGEVRLYALHGDAVLVSDTQGAVSEAYAIKTAAANARCTEINDVVLCRYYNQATYLIASLASQIRVETLHLPKPADEREAAIAARLEQEARLHGICVHYDAELLLAVYDKPVE